MLKAIWDFFFKPAPMNGPEGFERGYTNAKKMLAEHGPNSREAQTWRHNTYGQCDDYDRGIVKALDEAGVDDPLADFPELKDCDERITRRPAHPELSHWW